MAKYRAQKNILIQPADAAEPAVKGEFDFETREWVYDLTASDDKKYADALTAEGAVKDDSKPDAKSDAVKDSE